MLKVGDTAIAPRVQVPDDGVVVYRGLRAERVDVVLDPGAPKFHKGPIPMMITFVPSPKVKQEVALVAGRRTHGIEDVVVQLEREFP